MANSVYKINKGVDKAVEFKGLKAQYIWYLGGGLVLALLLFAILYLVGVNSYFCIALVGGLTAFLFTHVYKLSNKYGEYGMMKKIASRGIPNVIKCNDRSVFKMY
ncbi:DUF4133 domain-containing protein [Chitinophaga hostae]|uniref:DUF4133 domain-containing protein n=1 Tax=Chitinophaga hostae TaxID=2831022 RepID=A0ABS5IVX8_9BACT|nr:DUF4133 domain-containing protein [Chitinophaga hostae]MBS0027076.1 DUF4133 domain-containing protein [Chitinophaga hostae]